MKCDIILSGVGGQGILSIAAVIGEAVRNKGLYIKQAEVHGMSQRGGDVQTNLRISSDPIASDLIPLGSADAIISLEPMEALRYLPYLKADGWVVTSSKPFVNIPTYPAEDALKAELSRLPNLVMVDVEKIASEIGAMRSVNIVLLGAASSTLVGVDLQDLKDGIERRFASKGESVVEMNLAAFQAGIDSVVDQLKIG